MTIPTRPAPLPPQMRNGSSTAAAADANSSLERLRLQLQQQQQQQQQQKLTIKLPPPPKGGTNATTFPHRTGSSHQQHNVNNNIGEFDSANSATTSITRKFPKARYAPATNWDDAPFDPFKSVQTNGNAKKVPPPRPPPPKLLVNGRQKQTTQAAATTTSTNILANIFHRKKTNNSHQQNTKQQRVYGLSSGNVSHYESTATTNSTSSTFSAFTNADWNAAWSATSNNYATTTSTSTTTHTATLTQNQQQQEAQLISFDSPPSSPTFTQKSNSDCVSVDSFSSDSNFSSPQNGSVSQPESGFEDDFSASSRSRPATTSPLDPWETYGTFGGNGIQQQQQQQQYQQSYQREYYCSTANIGTAPVRNLTRATTTNTAQDNPLCNGRNLLPPPQAVSMPTIIKPKISQKPKAPRPPVFSVPRQQQQQQQLADADLPTPPSPPMPQCAPPPPPPTNAATATGGVSIFDVISGKADAMQLTNGAACSNGAASYDNETPYGIALYDFDGAEEGDLSFRENEKIYLFERVSEDWYRGRTRAGCEGILPVNYIEIKVPLSTETASSPIPTETITTENNHTNNVYNLGANAVGPKVRCLYNFPAEVAGDLELKENDMVTILYRINEDWLFGEINNRQGQFPANFLEYLPPNIPLP